MSQLQHISICNYKTHNKSLIAKINLSYQTFGQPLHTAPIVLINHALTGNSQVAGKEGWWSQLVGDDKVIDTQIYTVLAFNIPGNGYDGFVIDNYKDFIARDIAKLFILGLKKLEIHSLYAIIGGSLGGGIAWEMAVLQPHLTQHLIPVATDWKSTDWLMANCKIQEQFLINSKNPVHDARMHAMLCYRTPESFKLRFQRSKNTKLNLFNVESWLLHHGEKLQERFQLSAYKLMNQLLRTIDVTAGQASGTEVLNRIASKICIIAVDSDLFFSAEENRETQKQLALKHSNITYNEINSIHGHDAFLIEFQQLKAIIQPIFKPETNEIDATVKKALETESYQIQLKAFNKQQRLIQDSTTLVIYIAVFGHGQVGGTLIDQLIASTKEIELRKGVKFKIFAIANSTTLVLNANGIGENWRTAIENQGEPYTVDTVMKFAKEHKFKHLIAVDNTASSEFIAHYKPLIKVGFHLVSSNKIANTIDFKFYKDLRTYLHLHQKNYLYETNVGAGLPLIDTIKLLHLSGENITRIRGVFSGSLSYLFNTFSAEDLPFSEVLQSALDKGYTEPNPREDLSGNDVARKLLILARELDLHNELKDVTIENLIPESLRTIETSEFLKSFDKMNPVYQAKKAALKTNHVLRYIGDLHGDLSDDYGGKLDVKLVAVPRNSPLGALTGADSIFEIYTESYGANPIVIQGAGAGAEVTARGVFGDILRLTDKLIKA